jgi:hypothetical protein
MELHGLKLDDLIIGDSFLEERVFLNQHVHLFSGLDSSDDDTAGPWHLGSGNE